jgi:hypothetical protein
MVFTKAKLRSCRRSGKVLTSHLQPEFPSKYLNIPRDRQAAAAREVLGLSDSNIFIVQENPQKPKP